MKTKHTHKDIPQLLSPNPSPLPFILLPNSTIDIVPFKKNFFLLEYNCFTMLC